MTPEPRTDIPADAEPGFTLFELNRVLADLEAMRGHEWMLEQVAEAILRRRLPRARTIEHERH